MAGLNPENGELVWALPIEIGKTLLADPLPQGDVVYYSAQGGDLFKVMPKEGERRRCCSLVEAGTPAASPTPTPGTPAPATPTLSPTAGGTAGPSPTQVATP